ncbi:unnamed protein product [Pedinophyceae sp. YPF-701]|nr:unnamed protein product [Pedinophyceae sp. YPF-701]
MRTSMRPTFPDWSSDDDAAATDHRAQGPFTPPQGPAVGYGRPDEADRELQEALMQLPSLGALSESETGDDGVPGDSASDASGHVGPTLIFSKVDYGTGSLDTAKPRPVAPPAATGRTHEVRAGAERVRGSPRRPADGPRAGRFSNENSAPSSPPGWTMRPPRAAAGAGTRAAFRPRSAPSAAAGAQPRRAGGGGRARRRGARRAARAGRGVAQRGGGHGRRRWPGRLHGRRRDGGRGAAGGGQAARGCVARDEPCGAAGERRAAGGCSGDARCGRGGRGGWRAAAGAAAGVQLVAGGDGRAAGPRRAHCAAPGGPGGPVGARTVNTPPRGVALVGRRRRRGARQVRRTVPRGRGRRRRDAPTEPGGGGTASSSAGARRGARGAAAAVPDRRRRPRARPRPAGLRARRLQGRAGGPRRRR